MTFRSFRAPSSPSIACASARRLPRGLIGYVICVSGWHQLWIALLSIVVFLLGTIPLEVQRRIVNDAFKGHDFTPILLLSLLYAKLAVAEGLLKLVTNVYRGWIGESATRALREEIDGDLVTGHDRIGHNGDAGVGLSMIIAECEAIGGFVGDCVSEPLIQGGMLVAVFGYMVYLQPLMALVSFAVFTPQIVFVPLMQRAINRRVAQRILVLRQVSIDIFTITPAQEARSETDAFDLAFQLNMGIYKLKFSMNFLMNLFLSLGIAAILCLGGYYVVQGTIEIGTVVAFISGLSKIHDPWGDLVNWLRDLMVTSAKYRLVADATTAIAERQTGHYDLGAEI